MPFYKGTEHIFTNRDGGLNPTIYIKPGLDETLVIEGTTTGGSEESISYEAVNTEGTIQSFGIDELSPVPDPVFPDVILGYQVSIYGDTMIASTPAYRATGGGGRGAEEYKLSGSTWTRNAHLGLTLQCSVSDVGIIDLYDDTACAVHSNTGFPDSLVSTDHRIAIMERTGTTWADAEYDNGTAGIIVGDTIKVLKTNGTYVYYISNTNINGSAQRLNYSLKGQTIPTDWGNIVHGSVQVVTGSNELQDLCCNKTRAFISSTDTNEVYCLNLTGSTLQGTLSAMGPTSGFGKSISCNDTYLAIASDDAIYIYNVLGTISFITSIKLDVNPEVIAMDRAASAANIAYVNSNKIYYIHFRNSGWYEQSITDTTQYTTQTLSSTYPISLSVSGNWVASSNSTFNTIDGEVYLMPLSTQTIQEMIKPIEVTSTSSTITGLTGFNLISRCNDNYLGLPFVSGTASLKTDSIEAINAHLQYSKINEIVNSLNITDTTESTSSTTGALIVDGGLGVASRLNVGTRLDVGSYLTVSAPDRYIAYSNTSVLVSSGGNVAIGGNYYGNVLSSNGITHSSNVYTVSKAGYYVVGYSMIAQDNTFGGYRISWLVVNSDDSKRYAEFWTYPNVSLTNQSMCGSMGLSLSANDTITFVTTQNSGANINIYSDANNRGSMYIIRLF